MEDKVKLATVGLFVLTLGVALVAGILWLSSGDLFREEVDLYVTYMGESVSGLSVNAPVRYRGVEVGRVSEIALAPNDVEQVRIVLAIEQGTPIKDDTVAILQTQGLIGIGYIDLTGGSRDAPPLTARGGERYPVIGSGPSLIVRLDNALTALLSNLNETSTRINALLNEENRNALSRTLTSFEVVATTLAARSEEIDATIASTARAMENLALLSDDLPGFVARLEESADSFDMMADEIARAGEVVAGTAVEAGGDLRLIADDAVLEVQQMVGDLRELTRSLRRFTSQIEENPSILFHGKSARPPGPGE